MGIWDLAGLTKEEARMSQKFLGPMEGVDSLTRIFILTVARTGPQQSELFVMMRVLLLNRRRFAGVREDSPTLRMELTATFRYEGARGAQILWLMSPCPTGRGHCMKPSTLVSILTDLHLWVPVVVLILGTALLMSLR